MAKASTLLGATRWYLVGALPEDAPVAHLMTRSGDLRYRTSACGERESRTWTPVGPGEADPCPACAATRSGAPAAVDGTEQLAFDLPLP
ncbi:hypothetical protein [Amycolatopsis sp. PS_44_ISF1]|uniref:hypothetical protein n=1 Tax=Amycolatopsis sp. PS_44_ISF1 TaxID=2974917 RepID=UPI0028E05DE7|nr:hypothetical protein [Amycolatopsis sp. PS_44_ISF1]MDT8913817.1 hypothetical protein [Amycolatopsis sp. PS_44_ISF1]